MKKETRRRRRRKKEEKGREEQEERNKRRRIREEEKKEKRRRREGRRKKKEGRDVLVCKKMKKKKAKKGIDNMPYIRLILLLPLFLLLFVSLQNMIIPAAGAAGHPAHPHTSYSIKREKKYTYTSSKARYTTAALPLSPRAEQCRNDLFEMVASISKPNNDGGGAPLWKMSQSTSFYACASDEDLDR